MYTMLPLSFFFLKFSLCLSRNRSHVMTSQVHWSLEMRRDFHQVTVTKWIGTWPHCCMLGSPSPSAQAAMAFWWDFIFGASIGAVVIWLGSRVCQPIDTLPSGRGGNSQVRLGQVPRTGRGCVINTLLWQARLPKTREKKAKHRIVKVKNISKAGVFELDFYTVIIKILIFWNLLFISFLRNRCGHWTPVVTCSLEPLLMRRGK